MTNNQLTEIPVTDDEILRVLDAFDYRTGIESHEEHIVRCALAELQERRKADSEPVVYASEETLAYAAHGELLLRVLSQPAGDAIIPLYRHAQQPVVLADIALPHSWFDGEGVEVMSADEVKRACRAAMLQAQPVCTCPSGDGSLRWPCPVHPGNSPVIPEGYVMVPKEPTAQMYDAGDRQMTTKQVWDAMLAAAPQSIGGDPATVPGKWIPVSERMPETDGNYWGWWSESKRQGPVWFIKSELQAQFQSSEITHWMSLPAAPQEVKGE